MKKTENKRKRGRGWPIFKIPLLLLLCQGKGFSYLRQICETVFLEIDPLDNYKAANA